jgi:multidrug efflux pump
MMVVAGLAGLVVYASRYVVVEFFPTNDRNQFLLYIDLEAGTEISETNRVVDSVSTWLRDTSVNPEVTKVIAYAGMSSPSRSAAAIMELWPKLGDGVRKAAYRGGWKPA